MNNPNLSADDMLEGTRSSYFRFLNQNNLAESEQYLLTDDLETGYQELYDAYETDEDDEENDEEQ